jgi:hypothetical protein
MFDLFEHIQTTWRRTFAADGPAEPLATAAPLSPPGLAADHLAPGGCAGLASADDPSSGAGAGAPLMPQIPGVVLAGSSHMPTLAEEAGESAAGRLLAIPAGTQHVRTVVVIPAYNEETTLPEVIRAARAVPEVSEVVVVSDGSTDATAAVARENGAICIELTQNVGKGGAMKVGIDRADADVYVFLDADLIGVTPAHIQAMLHPVLRGQAPVVIAQLDGGRVATDLASVVAPNLSGQRAVTRGILQGMSGMETTRFGVEIAMKRYIKRNRVPMVRVPLDISHRTKEEKLGLLRGFLARLKEYWEIVKVAGE